MSGLLLEASGISMSYQRKPVLTGLDLQLKQGEICGLLGPNGAGKTTLLKVITGLVKQDQGEIRLFGESYRPALLRRVGCLIQRPALFSGKTVAENMRIHQTLLGIPQDRVEGILAKVGLGGMGDRKAGKLSLGQKQRLGIAMAILGNPDLLLLDEPFNGLDAQGIYELRVLIQSLNQENGVTIVVTSHLLDEVSRVATSYAILRDGCIQQHSGQDVQERSRQYAEIIVDNPQAATVVLDGFVQGEKGYEVMPDNSVRLYQSLDQMSQINTALVKANVSVQSFGLKTHTLTDFYLDETGRGQHRA